jgi:hypothetical protein
MEDDLVDMLLLIKKQSESNDHRSIIDDYLSKHKKKECVMMTSSGKMVDVCNLKMEDVCLEDILSSICSLPRYASHTGYIRKHHDEYRDATFEKMILTVGAHSLVMATILKQIQAPCEAIIWAAMHDFSEAYVIDMPRELKNAPELAGYRAVEDRVAVTVVKSLFYGNLGPEYGDLCLERLYNSRGFDLANVFDKEVCVCLEMPFVMNRRMSYAKDFECVSNEQILGMVSALCYRCFLNFPDIALDFDLLRDSNFLSSVKKMLLGDSIGNSEFYLRESFLQQILVLLKTVKRELDE